MVEQLKLPEGLGVAMEKFAASGFVPTCRCGHGAATHTFYGTGCWAARGEGYERDYCDCEKFEAKS